MQVLCIANFKGGVLKTSKAVKLSICFFSYGQKVLIVDADQQGNASAALGITPDKIENKLGHLMLSVIQALEYQKEISEYIITRRGIDILPSNYLPAGIELELMNAVSYTHLDVYKRQKLFCFSPAVSRL